MAASLRAARVAVGCAVLLGLLGCGAGSLAGGPAGLANLYLDPEHSQWLVGPIAHMATADEVHAYLALRDSAAAASFIEAFWARRGGRPLGLGTTRREIYEERAAQSDRLYSEAGVLGRHTDRGAVYILYGSPADTGYETGTRRFDPAVEVWLYKPTAPPGLDGRRPNPTYRFVKHGDLTVLYGGRVPQPLRRESEED